MTANKLTWSSRILAERARAGAVHHAGAESAETYAGTDPELDAFPRRGRCIECGRPYAWKASAGLKDVLSPCHLVGLRQTHRHLQIRFRTLERDYVLGCKLATATLRGHGTDYPYYRRNRVGVSP